MGRRSEKGALVKGRWGRWIKALVIGGQALQFQKSARMHYSTGMPGGGTHAYHTTPENLLRANKRKYIENTIHKHNIKRIRLSAVCVDVPLRPPRCGCRVQLQGAPTYYARGTGTGGEPRAIAVSMLIRATMLNIEVHQPSISTSGSDALPPLWPFPWPLTLPLGKTSRLRVTGSLTGHADGYAGD